MKARAVGIAVGTWAALAALWLLLDDLTALPELITGAVCAAIAAVGSELVRAHGLARSRPVARGLLNAWRPIARAPLDLGLLVAAIATRRRGRLLATPFRYGGGDPGDQGRRALAEGLGSFAPNTIVLGVDREQDLIFAHQLVHTGDPVRAIDPLELG